MSDRWERHQYECASEESEEIEWMKVETEGV